MNEVILKENVKIADLIYEIRGMQVIFDSDLAQLYGTITKRVNEAVKRNIQRFPEEFCFQVTLKEYERCSRSQIATLNKTGNNRGNNIKYLPYVFTEQGVAMLSSVLHTETAIKASIQIMNAFVAMRHYIGNNEYRLANVESKIIEHDKNIRLLLESFNKLEKDKEINEIYFDGKIYDAYSKILDIFSSARNELIVIDRYTDKTLLDMIKNLNCKVFIITSKNSKLTKLDIEKYNQDYHNLKVIYNNTFHDRYFIIDKEKIYHSGNSINHIGYRKSSINILHDSGIKEKIMEDVTKIIFSWKFILQNFSGRVLWMQYRHSYGENSFSVSMMRIGIILNVSRNGGW